MSPTTLTPGTRLGPFEILSSLGEGGMGAVYRARDSKLNRDVAIKVLLPAVANDPDRLARFSREAQVLASLNHPNIAHIHGLEETDGVTALVLELVEGEDLARRIARGPIPLDEALPIARQIADALEAAHEQGIIHRDLKPANIKVRPDGTVKVLDFGLAKAMEPAGASANAMNSPTLSMHATQAGIILGTAAYMSPEQAAGKPVDKRSDLWAFGVVLLEMLTGRQVFGGETTSHVLASVLKDAPDWTTLPPNTPAPIRKLLRRCLEKDRRKRLADAADARLEIEEALTVPDVASTSSSSVSSPLAVPAPSAWKRRASMLAAFAAGALLVGAAGLMMGKRSDAPVARALTYTPLSFEPGGNSGAVWSPDGKGVAFMAGQRDDEPAQVYVRYLDSSISMQLTHMGEPALPIAWTKAGRIIFSSTASPEGLWSISQTGGQAEPLLALVGRSKAASAGVSPDGSVIAYYGEQDGKYGIWISAPAGSRAQRYSPAPFEANASVNAPKVRFSPDGKQLLLLRNASRGEEAWLMPYPPDPNHPPRQIFEKMISQTGNTGTFSWMPDNRRVVMAIALGSEPSGLYVADTVTGSISLLSSGTTPEMEPAVSPDGARLAFGERTRDYDVLQVDLRTGDVSSILATKRVEQMPAWAMHAAVMAYVTDRTGEPEIWLHEPGRPDRPVVTGRDFPPGTTLWFMSPMVSPDGARIIYERIPRNGADSMWLSALSGGTPVRVTNTEAHTERPGAWSPDGAWFTYWDVEGTVTSVNRVRTRGQGTPEVLVPKVDRGPNSRALPAWSPNGEWILHQSNKGWLLLSPDGKTERDLALQATVCGFSRDGVELYCVRTEGAKGVLFSRLVAGGPERVIARLAANQLPSTQLNPSLKLTLTPDGQHVTFSALKAESNLWLLGGIGSAR